MPIPYDTIRTAIVKKLRDALGMPVIMQNQAGKSPPYPYATYLFTSPYLPLGPGNEGVEMAPEGVTLTKETHVEMVVSVTVHDKDPDRAYGACFDAITLFDFKGRDELRDAGVVVAGITNAQNRDTFLTIDYERRVGFDVRIRVTSLDEMSFDYIETAEIKYEG